MSHVLLAIAIVVAVVGVRLVLSAGVTSRYDYQCRKCGHVFSISTFVAAFAPHRFGGSKRLRCPSCGKRSWASRVPKDA